MKTQSQGAPPKRHNRIPGVVPVVQQANLMSYV